MSNPVRSLTQSSIEIGPERQSISSETYFYRTYFLKIFWEFLKFLKKSENFENFEILKIFEKSNPFEIYLQRTYFYRALGIFAWSSSGFSILYLSLIHI